MSIINRLKEVVQEYREYRRIKMQTIQIRLPYEQIKEIEGFVRDGTYASRSECVRDAVRKLVNEVNVGKVMQNA